MPEAMLFRNKLHIAMRGIARRAKRSGKLSPGGTKFANLLLGFKPDEDATDDFADSLATAANLPEPAEQDPPPVPDMPDHPFLQWIAQLFQWALANPDKIVAIIEMLAKLFGF